MKDLPGLQSGQYFSLGRDRGLLGKLICLSGNMIVCVFHWITSACWCCFFFPSPQGRGRKKKGRTKIAFFVPKLCRSWEGERPRVLCSHFLWKVDTSLHRNIYPVMYGSGLWQMKLFIVGKGKAILLHRVTQEHTRQGFSDLLSSR